ncbi:MAG: response regulator [Anaerolineae bacterium]|nr:response regulator [Anaerolineae bacterium]
MSKLSTLFYMPISAWGNIILLQHSSPPWYSVRAMVQHMPTILLVEQDDATRELYQRELGRRFRVVAINDVEQTLVLLQNEQFDALVLEPTVSNGAGWSVLETLQASPPRAPVRIVLCSALDERRRGMNLGAAAYLVKPVLPTALLSTLDQIL